VTESNKHFTCSQVYHTETPPPPLPPLLLGTKFYLRRTSCTTSG